MAKRRDIDTEKLLKYLQKLSPEERLAKRLTGEKMIRIKIYCQELVKIKQYIEDSETDIVEHGLVEIFQQGESTPIRRRNPSCQNFLEFERLYFNLVGKIERIIDGEIKYADENWE